MPGWGHIGTGAVCSYRFFVSLDIILSMRCPLSTYQHFQQLLCPKLTHWDLRDSNTMKLASNMVQ